MFYTPKNASGASVLDADAARMVEYVLSVDTGTGEVVVATHPFEVGADGELVRFTERYERIEPLFGGGKKPWMFHCFRRQGAKPAIHGLTTIASERFIAPLDGAHGDE